ncbi:MAG: hypothetical protein ACTSSP_01245 [Candidatus Asgardarchaeia archaeon]
MSLIDSIVSLTVVFLPLIVIFGIYLIAVPTRFSGFVKRVLLAFIAFWFLYQFSPAIIFYSIGVPVYVIFYGANTFQSWSYVFVLVFMQALLSLIYIAWYPIFLFSFAFFLAPFISILILALVVKPKNLKDVSFWIDLKERLKEEGFKDEKELLKLLIALLPVSLYFLTTLLRIFGIIPSLESLGWVLEVYLVYLLAFLTSVQILYTARVYFKDRFIGDSIRQKTFNNLLSISIVLSIISLIAFIQVYPESIYLFVYFSMYYSMAVIIFLCFYRYLELASIYFLSKILIFIKEKRLVLSRLSTRGLLVGIIIGIAGAMLSFVYQNLLVTAYWRSIRNSFNLYLSMGSPEARPILSILTVLLEFILLANLQTFFDYLMIIFVVMYISVHKLNTRPLLPALAAGIVKAINEKIIYFLIHGAEARLAIWVSSVFSIVVVGPSRYYILRFAFIVIDLSQIPAAAYLLEPFDVISILGAIVILSSLLYIISGDVFQITLIEEGKRTRFLCRVSKEQMIDRVVEDELKLIVVKSSEIPEELAKDEVINKVFNILKDSPKSLKMIKETIDVEEQVLLNAVRKLFESNLIGYLDCELKLSLPATFVDGIYVVNTNGLSIFSQTFGRIQVDPVLVSGMLSAITSFVKETTRSTQYLKTIDHGDVVLMIEYNPKFFVTILTNKETPELRMKLKKFVEEFDKKYGSQIQEGVVILEKFQDATQLVKEIFAEEIPS